MATKRGGLVRKMDWAIKGKSIGVRSGARHSRGLRWYWYLAVGAIPLVAVGVALMPTVLKSALRGGQLAAVAPPYPHDLAQVNFAVTGEDVHVKEAPGSHKFNQCEGKFVPFPRGN